MCVCGSIVNMPGKVSRVICESIVWLTILRPESLTQNDTEEFVRHAAVIRTDFSFVVAHLDLERFQQHPLVHTPQLIERVLQRFFATDIQH